MKKNTKIFIAIFILVVIGIFFVYPKFNSSTGNGVYDGFAQCLTDNGAAMYGTDWCSHCKDQKKLFGDSFKLVDFTDCDKDKNSCLLAGVQGYPTWRINGENYPGTQELGRLAQLSGCEL